MTSAPAGRSYRWSSLVETVAFAAILVVVQRLLHPEDPGYFLVKPHPLWAIVLLISLRYPLAESLLCAFLAGLVQVYYILLPDTGTFHFSAIGFYTDFKNPFLFVIVAGFVSATTQRLYERTAVLREQLTEGELESKGLQESARAATDALRQLESRIAGESAGVLDLFADLAQTKQMASSEIKRHLLDALARYLGAERAAYYDYERGRLVRRFSYPDESQENGTPDDVGRADDDLLLGEALRSAEVAHLGHFGDAADLDRFAGGALLAGSLRADDGRILGVASVEVMPFVDYNPHTFKLFGTILQWWSRVLEERLSLEELRARSVLDDELGIYNFSYFESRLSEEFERTRRFSLPMCLALVRIDHYDDLRPENVAPLKQLLARILRENVTPLEMVAHYRSQDVLAISFAIAMASDVEERLRKIVKDIESFEVQSYADAEQSLEISWCLAEYEIGMENHTELLDQAERLLTAGTHA